MPKARTVPIVQTVNDAPDALSIRFYISDASANPPNVPWVQITLPAVSGDPVHVDRPLSDFTSLTPAQKANLRTLLTAVRDQALALEGFA